MEPVQLATALATAVLSVHDPIPEMQKRIDQNRRGFMPEIIRQMEANIVAERWKLLRRQVQAVADVMTSIEV